MLKEKGQGIVEYALLLAFIVGLAVMLNGSNIGGAVKGVFDDVVAVLKGESKYASMFRELSTKSLKEIAAKDNQARLEADSDALDHIAEFFYGKTKDEILKATGYSKDDGSVVKPVPNTNLFGTTDGKYDGTKATDEQIASNKKYSTQLLNYWTDYDNDTVSFENNDKNLTSDWLKGEYGTARDANDWVANTKYFYSDEMIRSGVQHQVRAVFSFDSNPNENSNAKVNSVRVFVVDNDQKNKTRTMINNSYLDRTYDSNGAHATY